EDMVVYRTPAPNLLACATGMRDWLKGLLRRSKGKTPGPAQAPAGARPERRGGWLDWASWWLQIPDMMVGWLPFGLYAAYRAVHRHHCQAIYSTAPPWADPLIALPPKSLTGRPWGA